VLGVFAQVRQHGGAGSVGWTFFGFGRGAAGDDDILSRERLAVLKNLGARLVPTSSSFCSNVEKFL
jgi:hypothetical protein